MSIQIPNLVSQNRQYGTFTVSSTLDIFGDSVVNGIGASTTANRWSTQLCSILGVTENNRGINSDQWLDSSGNIYGSHVAGRSVIMLME